MSPSDRHPEADWLPAGEALARILHAIEPLPSHEIALKAALGKAIAEDVVSPVTLPAWDNSAMDGYALRHDDIRGASQAHPVRLRIVDRVAAGSVPTRSVGAGEAIQVMTGAPIPRGADSVVRVEDTDSGLSEPGSVTIHTDRDGGHNIRPRGEDLREGDVVVKAGTTLLPAHIGVLASVGRGSLRVHASPRVAVLSSGDELVNVDSFEEVLAGRRVPNSNAPTLAAAVQAAGGQPIDLGIARDNRDDIRRCLEPAPNADALVTSAGASVGERDLLKSVLGEMGFRLAFWRVKMRPGSPFSYGSLSRAERAPMPVFGVPGNPVSAIVTFELFVRPALRKLGGHRSPFRATVAATAGEPLPAARGLTHFVRVRLACEDGVWTAWPTGAQGSAILMSVAAADGLAIVPADVGGIPAHGRVTVILLDSGSSVRAEPPF